jgi:hypothetical protein
LKREITIVFFAFRQLDQICIGIVSTDTEIRFIKKGVRNSKKKFKSEFKLELEIEIKFFMKKMSKFQKKNPIAATKYKVSI